MKNKFYFLVAMLVPLYLLGQTIEGLTFVSPIQNGYTSVLKANKWGIIDSAGVLVVDYRSDLIYNENPTTHIDLGVASIKFPGLYNGRAVIKKTNNGINYFGFIDATGSTVIEPQYLNVSNFKNGLAFALKIEEKFLGTNDLLDIKVKSYRYDIVLINKKGEVNLFLAGPFPIGFSEQKLKNPPPIEARWIGKQLVAVKTPDKTWKIINITPRIGKID